MFSGVSVILRNLDINWNAKYIYQLIAHNTEIDQTLGTITGNIRQLHGHLKQNLFWK